MAEYTAQELFEILNESDECAWIEAKGIGDSAASVMETVCSYANEPGLGGGYILMSISADLRELKGYELLISKGKGKATYYVPGSMLVNTLNTQGDALSTQPPAFSTQPPDTEIPLEILNEIASLRKKEHNLGKVSDLILKVCDIKPMISNEIALIFNKREDYIRRKYLNKLIVEKKLRYLYPEMINHPNQAYLTNSKKA